MSVGDRATVKILVLCAGNIGRSPLAEILLRHSLAGQLGTTELSNAGVIISSAGTAAPEGHLASSRGVAFAADLGLDLTEHRATLLTSAAIQDADWIYCMDNDQLDAVISLVPQAAAKTELWAGEGTEIPDPHHQSDEFFRNVAKQILSHLPKRATDVIAMIDLRTEA